MRSVKRAVMVRPGSPIEVWSGDIPSPQGGDVLVTVEMAGVCGTDYHYMLGDIELPGPMVLGHEGIGRVVELGPEVSTDYAGQEIAAGDLVYWIPLHPCHRCHACTVLEDVSQCKSLSRNRFRDPLAPPTATFSEQVVLPDGMAFFRVPAGAPPEAVIALGCALPTMLHAFERLGRLQFGQDVIVQGCGPVGLAATMLSRLSGARNIVVVGGPRHRLEMAKRLGATDVLDLADQPDPTERVEHARDLLGARGADVVIEATGFVGAFTEGVDMCAAGGRYLIVGLWSASGEIPLAPRTLNNRNLRVIGSALERPRHLHQALEVVGKYHREFPIADLVSHRFALADTQLALEAVGRQETVKAVIVPGLSSDSQ